MISSCSECTVSCCQTGPGPHKSLPPDEYLENFGDSAAYNTKCIAFVPGVGCNLWGTPEFPQACRVYVCQTRSYTPQELKRISDVIDRECPSCGCEWLIGSYIGKEYHDSCEVCGHVTHWKRDTVTKGSKKWHKKKKEPTVN